MSIELYPQDWNYPEDNDDDAEKGRKRSDDEKEVAVVSRKAVVNSRGRTSLAFSKAHELELFWAKAREPSRAYEPPTDTYSPL